MFFLSTGVRNGTGQEVMNVIVLLVASEGLTAMAGLRKHSQAGATDPFVCPSVCPSDWDKRKTLVVKGCLAGLYGEGSKTKRRGQEPNYPRKHGENVGF